MKCFCGGDGKYVDYNCGASFFVECPHCQGSGTKKCACKKADPVCKTYGRGSEIIEKPRRFSDVDDHAIDDDYDNPHWMFMD